MRRRRVRQGNGRDQTPLAIFRASVETARKHVEQATQRALTKLEREIRTLERERKALRVEIGD